ncbi:MAG: WHG domain-containing protein [Thalassobaculaceae bacterium]|nr:WHG domain-containing protein [Thalassobaculaceae bacterium]
MTVTNRPTPDANALLAAAGAVLKRDGIEGLTVRAIAKQANTTTMAIYSRLGGKDGVLDAINREGFLVLSDALKQALASSPTPAASIASVCRTVRNFAATYPSHYRVMFGTPPEGYIRNAAAEQRARDIFTLLREPVAALIGDGTASTDTYALFALCHGLIEGERGPMAGIPPSPDTAFSAAIGSALRALEARVAGPAQSVGPTPYPDIAEMRTEERIEYADLSVREEPARNAPCPCGSGKRYKHCHGAT